MNLSELRKWIGRQELVEDCVSQAKAAAVAAMLDRKAPAQNDSLPLLWHWLYCLSAPFQSELDEDGHARRGEFLPPVPCVRRIWAGSSMTFHGSFYIGDKIRRASRVHDLQLKHGSSGEFIFVQLEHVYHNVRGPIVIERQDIAFCGQRVASPASVAPSAPAIRPDHNWLVTPDSRLLFRYSALTFNAHRIHYDWPYATEREGYPALVVQGPLVATLLADLWQRDHPAAQVQSLIVRASRPLFSNASIDLRCRDSMSGEPSKLWAIDSSGAIAMEMSIEARRELA